MIQKISWAGIFLLVFAIIVWLGCGEEKTPSTPGSFSADMTEQIQNNIFMSKIFVKGEKYRMEQHQQGETLYVLVDQIAGKTRVLIPSQKQYLEIGAQDMMSLMNDPFQGLKYALTMAEKEDKGREKVSGFECQKAILSLENTEAITYWMSTELSFPLRIIMHGQGARSIELSNIKREELDDAMFEIPEGYMRMVPPSEAPQEIPDWGQNLGNQPLLTEGAERMLAAGDVFRVQVVPGKAVRIYFENLSDSNTSYSTVPFKDGRPTKDISVYTANLAGMGMAGTATLDETPYEADEIVVHLNEGKVRTMVELMDIGEGEKVSMGGEYRKDIMPDKNIEMRLVNLTDGDAEAVYTYYKDGKEMSEEVIGPAKYRRILFNRQYNNRKRTLAPEGDKLVVRVIKGEIYINAYQNE